jgi:outer membrane protein
MRKLLSILTFLIIAVRGVAAGDTAFYSLKQCIDAALKYNATVAQAGFREATGAALRMQSRGTLLPSVSTFANQGINQGKSINPFTNTFINQQIVTGTYGLNASLVLFNGGSGVNTMRAQTFSYEADKLNYEQTVLDIRISVTLAYLQVLSLSEQLERLATLEKNNAVSPALLYDTRGQSGNEKINFINTQAAYETAKQALGELMNTTFNDRVKFEPV